MTATEIINEALGLMEDDISKKLKWPEVVVAVNCNMPVLALGVPGYDKSLTEMLREDYGQDQ